MTYGRAYLANNGHVLNGADVSHSAELARGDFLSGRRPPHLPFGHLLPKGGV
jgi:hypothetical protein